MTKRIPVKIMLSHMHILCDINRVSCYISRLTKIKSLNHIKK